MYEQSAAISEQDGSCKSGDQIKPAIGCVIGQQQSRPHTLVPIFQRLEDEGKQRMAMEIQLDLVHLFHVVASESGGLRHYAPGVLCLHVSYQG